MIPSENPSLFCKAAVLPRLRHGPGAPRMPVPGHHSRLGRLSERPDPHRSLIIIEPLDDLQSEVTKFHDDLPAQNPNVQSRDIPNPFASLLNTQSDSLICIASAVRRTILAATGLVLSNLPYQWISSRNNAHLAKGVSTMLWTDPNSLSTESSESPAGSSSSQTLCEPEIPKAIVAAFVQEPWVLSPKDFEAFCSLQELRNYVPKFAPNNIAVTVDKPWGQAQQLWAFIHDRCEEHQCHFFIVTSYEQWAFGCFSKAWTHAFITRPHASGDTQQTIMERTLHWVLSATLQSEYKGNRYVAPEGLPWMDSLYVVPEIIGEVSWAAPKPNKRRLSDEEDDPISTRPPPRRPFERRRPRVAHSPAPSLHRYDPAIEEAPPLYIQPTPSFIAGVDAWRQRIPTLVRTRGPRPREERARRQLPRMPPSIPHDSPFGPQSGQPATPPRRAVTPDDSPGRLRLPPHLQSPAREAPPPSEHSGDTALDDTDGLSMEVVAVDVQSPQAVSATPRVPQGGLGRSRLGDDAQMRGLLPVGRQLFSVVAPSLPHESGSTAPQSNIPRRTTRLVHRRLRQSHLAGTISTLTEENFRDV